MIEVSVVCSTYQRAHRLPEWFRALEAQTFAKDRFEVVIVDDGSKDATREVLAELVANSALNVNLILQPQNKGAATGRNTAIRAAQAELLAFTDDDCAPAPDWLETGITRLRVGDADIVVGRTEPNPDQATNKGPFSRTLRITERSGRFFMQTCNIFYKKADILAVGGFDEKFVDKGGEDTDMGWRIVDSGRSVTFAPDALVFHDVHPGNFRAAIKEAFTSRFIARVRANHPARTRPALIGGVFWSRMHMWVLLLVLGVVATVAARNPLPLVAALPWLYHRLKTAPAVPHRVRRFVYLPARLIVDGAEVAGMVYGSAQNRTLIL